MLNFAIDIELKLSRHIDLRHCYITISLSYKMSFELDLINFWIERLNFQIKDDKLFLRLKACNIDIMRSHLLLLSDNVNDILDFFGFDISIDYMHLKPYNIYEFMSTTVKLYPEYISYYGFKGPHPKNQNHVKFNDYLKQKFRDVFSNRDQSLETRQKEWMERAIEHFSKQNKYVTYLEQHDIITAVIKKMNIVAASFSHIKRFLMLHGLLRVKNWDDARVTKEWQRFQDEEWAGLRILTP